MIHSLRTHDILNEPNDQESSGNTMACVWQVYSERSGQIEPILVFPPSVVIHLTTNVCGGKNVNNIYD
jgi:hypothetical protein